MAGRREVPVDPGAGPVQRFAFELRKLRTEAGGLTYRAMAEQAGYSITTLSQAAAGEQLPTLPVALAFVTACGGDPAEWEIRWHQVVEEAAAFDSENDDGEGAEPPYRGLARFETDDSGLFFGRDRLTTELVGLLRRRRFAAVFGPSGIGKSSLLRAGLIPVLRESREPGLRPSAIRILTPGDQLARTHELLLEASGGGTGADDGDRLVVVDQFEEVFTLCHDAAERARFIDLLLTARDPESRLRVLIAVRADFYGRCAEHRELAEALGDANLLAGPMSSAELREVVVKPAAAAGLTVERALTTRLVEEITDAPGGLPLLSHVLLETWRRRRGKTLTLAGYEAAGGLDGAIAKTAEDVHRRFTEGEAATARRVLLRLISPGDGTPDTRRPAGRAELETTGTGREEVARVLEALTRARLLTLDGPTVEVAHEALITAWPRLRGWIEEDRDRLRAHRQLTEAARAWEELGRDTGALYRGSRLVTAREYFGASGQADGLDGGRGNAEGLSGGSRRGGGPSRGSRDGTRRGDAPSRDLSGGSRRGDAPSHDLSGGSRRGDGPSRRLSDDLTGQEAAFLGASLAAVDQEERARVRTTRRLRVLVTSLACLLALALTATAVAYWQRQSAVDAQRAGLSRQLAAQSTALLDSDTDLASLLAIQAYRTSPTREATRSLYAAAAVPLERRLTGHSGTVGALAYSPDGKTLATGSHDGTVRLWDTATGRTRKVLSSGDGLVRAVAFSPDGRALVTSGGEEVRLWDAATGRVRDSLTVRVTEENSLASVGFDHDGRALAVRENGQVLDVATGRVATTLKGPTGLEMAVEFSPDGRTLATSTRDHTAQLWDLDTGRALFTVKSGTGVVSSLAFDPEGKTLVTGTEDGTVHLWDAADGKQRNTLTSASSRVETMAFSPDGKTLAAGSYDGTVRLWDLAGGRVRTTLTGHINPVMSVAFSPDGERLAAGNEASEFAGGDRVSVRLWNVTAHRPRATATVPGGRLAAVAYGPDGDTLATASVEMSHEMWDTTGVVRLWDPATRRAREMFTGEMAVVGTMTFSPDGRTLALTNNAEAQFWDVATRRLRTTLPTRFVNTMVYSPDGRTLVSVGDGLVLWDVATGRSRVSFRKDDESSVLAFSPTGDVFATGGGNDEKIRLRDPVTGRVRVTLSDPAGRPTPTPASDDEFIMFRQIESMAFSQDGKTLAAGSSDGTVRLWDTETGQLDTTLTAGTTEAPVMVAFSPDGRTLATTASDSTVRLWDIATGYTRVTLTGHGGGPETMAFSPDGHTLATGDSAGRLRLWNVDLPAPDKSVANICRAIHRDLTQQERTLYLPDQEPGRVC